MKMLFGKPGRDEFAAMMQGHFAHVLGDEKMVYDAEEFCLRIGDPASRTVNLVNVHMEYCAAPFWRRGKIITAWLETIAVMEEEFPATLEEARHRLLPQVRERFTWDLLKLTSELQGSEKFEPPPVRIVAGDLSVEVVYDMPRSTRTLSTDALKDWGTDFDSVLEIARDNLRNVSAPNFKKIAPGVYVSQWRDNFDAARIMATDVLFELEVKGHPVVFVPHRDEMVVTGTLEEEGLAVAAQHVVKSLQGPRPITGKAYRLGGVEWFPFLPPPEHPAYNVLKQLAMENVASCYNEQENYLQKLLEKRGEDVFVGSQMLVRDPSGIPQSICVWTKGVDTFLAESDFVFFVDPDKEPNTLGEAPWARVREVLDDRMEAQGLYPERYRVRSFPSDEELETLALAQRKKPSVQ